MSSFLYEPCITYGWSCWAVVISSGRRMRWRTRRCRCWCRLHLQLAHLLLKHLHLTLYIAQDRRLTICMVAMRKRLFWGTQRKSSSVLLISFMSCSWDGRLSLVNFAWIAFATLSSLQVDLKWVSRVRWTFSSCSPPFFTTLSNMTLRRWM